MPLKINPATGKLDLVNPTIDATTYLQYTDTFTTSDWSGAAAPYYLTYLQATHLQGETENLTVNVKKDNGDDSYDEVIADIKNYKNGNVYIYSNEKFDGVVNIGQIGGLGNINFVDAKKDAIGASGDAGDEGVITQGIKYYIDVPYNCTVSSYSLTSGDGSPGNISVDVWKSNGSIPEETDSILDSNYLELTGQAYYQSADLSGWTTTTVTAGDVICFNITEDSTLQKISINLWVTKA